jgi:hypothetical protein
MKHIAPQAATAAEPTLPVTPPEAWTGFLLITPDMVQQILDANELADATEEQA